LIWQHLLPPWQAALEEAWLAFGSGSLPHGAVITDADGHVVSRGRNRINEKAVVETEQTVLHGHRLAHAELNALTQTDWSTVDPRTCILYSTIEPCPMCIGAVRMANVREVRYAARDNTSGASSLIDKTPFLKNGNLHVLGSQDVELEILLLAMLIESALSHPSYPAKEAWAEQLSLGVPLAGQLGHKLYESQQLRQWLAQDKDTAFVVDRLAEQARQMQATTSTHR
jgi:tRNA(adenine34) deaminase